MSLHEYQVSLELKAQDPPFYALIMAAFRKADTDNRRKLQHAFPQTWLELKERYNAPGGRLEGELPDTIMGTPVKVVESTSEPMNLALGNFNDYDHREKKKKEKEQSSLVVDTHHSETQLDLLLFDLNFEEEPKLPGSWDQCTDEELEAIAKEL